MVRYGNVTYPIDVKKVLPNRDTNKFDLGDITVIFEAKPNTLSIAPSREGLVYDEKQQIHYLVSSKDQIL